MNLDDLLEGWRSQDASTFFGVDKTLLRQVLRQEQAELEKQSRRETWGGYVVSAVMLFIAAATLVTMFQPNDDDVLGVGEYVVGIAAVAGPIIVVWTLFALRRSRHSREQRFGDSLRDHLRRRITQMDDAATGERRIGLIFAGGVDRRICHPHRSTACRRRARALQRNGFAVAVLDRPDRRVALPGVVHVGAPPRCSGPLSFGC